MGRVLQGLSCHLVFLLLGFIDEQMGVDRRGGLPRVAQCCSGRAGTGVPGSRDPLDMQETLCVATWLGGPLGDGLEWPQKISYRGWITFGSGTGQDLAG